jgi:hypothetical protein
MKKLDESKQLVKSLVDLWQETQLGHYKKCQEKHFEFCEVMLELREEIYGKEE